MEIDGSSKESSNLPGFNEPNFRLNIKRNFKGDYGFEYTVKADNIDQLKEKDFEMRGHLYEQGLISRKPIKNADPQRDLPRH